MALVACSDKPVNPDDQLQQLIATWQAEYAPAPDTSGAIHPYVMIRKVDIPAFGPNAVYMEIRDRTRSGRITRQRIFAFDDRPGRRINTMKSYDFLENGWAPYAGAFDRPELLSDLDPAAMYSFPDGCEVLWRTAGDIFVGETSRERCHIVSRRSGDLVHADMVFTVTDDYFAQHEIIFNDQGVAIVGDPEGPPIVSERVATIGDSEK